MLHHIVINMTDHPDSFIMKVETDNASIDPVAALRAAAQDFRETEEFRKYMMKRNEMDGTSYGTKYNWIDLINSIPDDITSKHGVTITSILNCRYVVNCNENLLS